MVSLFESKLNSLPPNIVSQYPQLENFKIDDFSGLNKTTSNQNLAQTTGSVTASNTLTTEVKPPVESQVPVQIPQPESVPAPAIEETPSEKLEKLVQANPELEQLKKLFKVGILSHQVSQRGMMIGIDKNLLTNFVDLYLQANPSAKWL